MSPAWHSHFFLYVAISGLISSPLLWVQLRWLYPSHPRFSRHTYLPSRRSRRTRSQVEPLSRLARYRFVYLDAPVKMYYTNRWSDVLCAFGNPAWSAVAGWRTSDVRYSRVIVLVGHLLIVIPRGRQYSPRYASRSTILNAHFSYGCN